MASFEKTRNTITITLFLALLFLPHPLYLLLKNHFPNTNTENRPLAELPTLSKDSLPTFFDDFSSFYNDHLPFRAAMKSLYGNANYRLFGGTTDSVLVGKDGWLFYRNLSDSSPVHQVQAKTYFSTEEMQNFAAPIAANFAYAASRGIDLYYLVLPSKENLYREYLPTSVTIFNEDSAAENFIAYLNNDRIIYPKAELLTVKESEEIYFKTDSHWNPLGAFVGYQALSQAIASPVPSRSELSVELESGYSGDLSKLAGISGPADVFPKVTYASLSSKKSDDLSDTFLTCGSSSAKNSKTIMLIGDSYRLALIQYLCADYQQAVILHRGAYAESLLDTYHPDILIIEYVERYFSDTLPLHTP